MGEILEIVSALSKFLESLFDSIPEEQRHFQAPRLDLLKAERVPPPRPGGS